MKGFRRALLALALGALSGCATQFKNMQDTSTISDGSGIVVTHIVFNARNEPAEHRPLILTAIRDTNFTTASLVVKVDAHEAVSVVTLPAGSYSWRGLYIEEHGSEFRGLMPFTVQAGKVNYVGDLVVTIDWDDRARYGLHVVSDATGAASYMQRAYPKIAQHYPMVTNLTVDRR